MIFLNNFCLVFLVYLQFLLFRLHHSHLEGMEIEELVDMLAETTVLDEQASLVHFLWLKFGLNFDTKLNNVSGVTVRILCEEVYVRVITLI